MKKFFYSLFLAGLALFTEKTLAYQWIQIASDPQATYHKILFLDQQNGFIVGEKNGQALLLRTTTGGRTFGDWQQVSLPVTTPLYDIHFRDLNNGYAVGNARTIIVTSDGGASWSTAANTGIDLNENLRAVFFLNGSQGWVGSQNTVSGNIYWSGNGGSSWTRSMIFLGAAVYDLLFLDGSRGLATASASCLSSCLFVTLDGGQSWSEVPAVGNAFLFSLTRVADNDIWIAGNFASGGALIQYNGSTWQRVATPTANLRQVAFSGGSSQNGWAVGAGGVILRRVLGGSWELESSPVNSDLWSVVALSEESALAVGANGVILLRGCAISDECNDFNECTQDICDNGNCRNEPMADGTSCSDDGNICTDDVCQTGLCTHPFNSAPCNDGNLCTQTDTCQNGTCVGQNPVTCTASDQCHDAGTCDPATGLCSNLEKPNGTPCNDGNLCTQTDTCQNGTCVGQNPVTCTASDQCHDAGTCNPATGLCSNPEKPNGTPCNDGLFCTVNDACREGVCSGEPNDCSQLTGPCLIGICDEDTDTCQLAGPKPAGTACEPCGRCDGQGSCQPSSDRAGDVCDYGQKCTGEGICDTAGICVIEGWCNEILPGCTEPAASYQPGSPDCRLPDDKVLFLAEVPRQHLAFRTPARVDIFVFNNTLNSRTGFTWNEPLRDLRLVLELEQKPASLSYVEGSAVYGGQPLSGKVEGATFFWSLPGELDTENPGHLSFTLLLTSGSWQKSAFKLRAEAPCHALPEEVGCHSPTGWQVVGREIRVPLIAGVQFASGQSIVEYDEQVGCQCSSSEGKGFLWLVLLAWLSRRMLAHERDGSSTQDQ